MYLEAVGEVREDSVEKDQSEDAVNDEKTSGISERDARKEGCNNDVGCVCQAAAICP